MATLREFFVGHCNHPECMVLQGGSLRAREFPARAWLIESRGKRILWDTGYAQHFFTQARGIYRLYAAVTPAHLSEGEDLVSQLRRADIDPTTLDALVLSHMHADHVAGLADFPGVPLYAAQAAWDSIEGVAGLRALLQAHIPGLMPADQHAQGLAVEGLQKVALPLELAPFDRGWALTDEVVCIPLPGHARGHLGVFVRTDAGWELIASDAAWDRQAYESLRGPSRLAFLIQDDRQAYYETLRKLQTLHRQGIRIHLSHAPRPAGACA